MAVNVEDIDWVDAILTYGGSTPEVFIDRLDDEKWIIPHCLTACDSKTLIGLTRSSRMAGARRKCSSTVWMMRSGLSRIV